MGSNDYYNNYYGQDHSQSQQPQQYSTYSQQSGSSAQQYIQQQYPSQTYHSTSNSNSNTGSSRTNAYTQGQPQPWNDNYDGAQDGTGRAAEALRNLSNTAYSSNSAAAVSSPHVTNANTATAPRYGSNLQQQENYSSSRTPPTVAYHPSIPRPASVNRNATGQRNASGRHGLPLPNTTTYPAQTAYAAAAVVGQPSLQSLHQGRDNTQRTSVATSTAYEPNSRSLPTLSNTKQGTVSNPYQYHTSTSNVPAAATSTTNSFGQTVDPIDVYDPWPEIQRKQAAAKAVADEAARVEAIRAEAERKEREAEAERLRQQEEAEKRSADELEAKRLQDEAEKERKKKQRAANRKAKAMEKSGASGSSQVETPTPPAATADGPVDEEAQIRELMAKMRQFNSKNPNLLAKIWEEERKGNQAPSPKSANKALAPVDPPAVQSPISQTPIPLPGSATTKGKATANQTKPRAAPVKSPVMPTKPQGGAVWPPEKRQALAAAAARWLNGIRGNELLQITSQDICDRLDESPTYIELCEWLEGLGMTLERASFARHLLEAVPDVNQNARSTPKLTTQRGTGAPSATSKRIAGATDHATQVTNGSVLEADSAYPMPDVEMSDNPYYASVMPPFPPQSDAGTPGPAPVANMKDGEVNGVAEPAPTKPASKEEAARKKNFSDLIDLSQLSDDDLPQPVQRPGFIAPSAPFAPPKTATGTFEPPTLVEYQSHFQPSDPYAGGSFAPFQQSKASPAFTPAPSYQSQQLSSASQFQRHVPAPPSGPENRPAPLDVVKPLDRKKALRRSTYDSKTIARDVLLATGKHPEMRALNAHLEVLKTTFRLVDNTADLSTFRWDLVDPGQPPKEMLGGGHEVDFADDEEDDEDDDERARPSVAQAVAVGTGPSSGVPGFTNTIPPVNVPSKKRGRPRSSYPQSSRPNGFATSPAMDSAGAHHHQAANHGPSVATPGNTRHLSDHRAPASATGSRNQADSTTPGSGSGTGYAALRAVGPDGTPIKKKGRPVGWRKAIHGSAAAKANTSKNRYTKNAASGPQSSALRNVTTAAQPIDVDTLPAATAQTRHSANEQPIYKVYKCKWQHCSAELHNLETLRKHVFKLHNKQAPHGGYDCLWSGCGQNVKTKDRRTGQEKVTHHHLDFTEMAEWQAHIEQSHFSRLAWQHGDGPASGTSDAEMSEAYLSDSHGRRVTPRVSIAPDQMPPAGGPADTQRRPGRPPKRPVEEEAREAQKDMEAYKRALGPGIDRGGARLANEKRRTGFMDDDDREDVVAMEQ